MTHLATAALAWATIALPVAADTIRVKRVAAHQTMLIVTH